MEFRKAKAHVIIALASEKRKCFINCTMDQCPRLPLPYLIVLRFLEQL